jgi:hypothetical protein
LIRLENGILKDYCQHHVVQENLVALYDHHLY